MTRLLPVKRGELQQNLLERDFSLFFPVPTGMVSRRERNPRDVNWLIRTAFRLF